jgi:hypothetical protein
MTIYTPPAPTVDGQTITVSHLLNSPVLVQRTLRSLVNLRLVGGRVLTGRVDMTGSGSAIFEIGESIYATDEAETIDDLMEYPLTDDGDAELAVVAAGKYGLATDIPDALIARNRMDVVMRKLTKIANRIAVGFDGRVISAVGSAVTQTQAAAAAWNTTNADPFLDAMLAGAVVDELDEGYAVDTLLAKPAYYARLVAQAKIMNALPRESDSIVLSGRMTQIAGYNIIKTNRLPSGVNVMALDSTALGSIAFERQGGGYQGDASDPTGVESKVIRLEHNDGVRIQARKVAEPVVVEPGAGVKLTGA